MTSLEQYTAEYNAAVANGHIEKARRLARVIAALEYNLVTRPSVAPEEDDRIERPATEPRPYFKTADYRLGYKHGIDDGRAEAVQNPSGVPESEEPR